MVEAWLCLVSGVAASASLMFSWLFLGCRYFGLRGFLGPIDLNKLYWIGEPAGEAGA